jgi:hypothetical protein
MSDEQIMNAEKSAREQLERLNSLSERELLVLVIMELRHTNGMLRRRWSK